MDFLEILKQVRIQASLRFFAESEVLTNTSNVPDYYFVDFTYLQCICARVHVLEVCEKEWSGNIIGASQLIDITEHVCLYLFQ